VKYRALSRLVLLAGCAVLVSVASSRAGHAQSFDPNFDPNTRFDPNNVEADSFDRGQNVSVRERPRPDYQAEGIHVGGFLVYPKVTVSGTYDDNIFALQTHKLGDAFFSVAPEVDFQSTWSRNALAGYIRASQDVYAKHTTENDFQYGLGANGKYEFGNAAFGEATLTGGADYGLYTLPRSAANSGQSSLHPIQYDFTEADAELADTFNRLRVSARVDYEDYAYLNASTPAGAPLFEQALNHTVVTFTGKAEYALSPDTAVFVTAAYNNRVYDHQPPSVPFDDNNNGYNFGGGANFDLTHLIRGEIQLGWMDQTYVSPVFEEIRGLSAKGQLEWFPTQLTTVTATALRTVGDSGLIHSAGYLNTTGEIQIDHELLRNLILTANATDTEDQYNGINRTDNIWSAGASADWLVKRWLGFTLAYTFTEQRSVGVDRGVSFNDNRVTVSAVLQR
jgi:hypothetical protein